MELKEQPCKMSPRVLFSYSKFHMTFRLLWELQAEMFKSEAAKKPRKHKLGINLHRDEL